MLIFGTYLSNLKAHDCYPEIKITEKKEIAYVCVNSVNVLDFFSIVLITTVLVALLYGG